MSANHLTPDRRHFLRAGAAAALGLAGLPGPGGAGEQKDPFGGFKLGAQSYTFRRFNTEQTLKRMQDLGLRYVEFYSAHVAPTSTPQQVQALLRLCRGYDVKPLAFGVQRFTRDHDANRKLFEFGKELGITMFSADPDPDSFDSLDRLCAEYRIAIGIHPHGPQGNHLHRWYSAEVILRAVKDHHPLIGSCLDTGHLIRAAQLGKKLDPAQEIRTMGARNFGLHLKDHDNVRQTDVIFGRGTLNLPAVLRAARAVHFKGLMSIEYEAHEEDPSPDVRECIRVFKESVRKLG
jgi:sugar phosphate isomerase/epimerase